MSMLQFPCGSVPENSCETCKSARYEVSFPDATGVRRKICGPCLGGIFTALQDIANTILDARTVLRSMVPTDEGDHG